MTSHSSSSPRSRPALAVALGYEAGRDAAPRVVATGRGAVAERICQSATDSGVPVREDNELAEALSVLDVGQMIPAEVFAAVAEILVYLYRLNGRMPDTSEQEGKQG